MKKLILLLALFAATVASAQTPDGAMKPQKEMNAKKINAEKKAEEKAGTRQNVYIYGVAMSMQDSVVYVTDELVLNNVVLQKKTKFLENRPDYAAQLAKHMAQKGEKNRICSVTFATSVKALDKKYTKQVAKLRKQGYLVKSVGQGEFRFVPVDE